MVERGSEPSLENRPPRWTRSWVATRDEMDERIRAARQIVGMTLQGVRYFDVDYLRDEQAPDAHGPRLITDAVEWERPNWRHELCDSVDYGVEIRTSSDLPVSIAWDPPGHSEGIGIGLLPMLGSRLAPEVETAIWEVGNDEGWRRLMGRPVTDIELHYEPWGDGFWCPRITLRFLSDQVVLMLGEAMPDGTIGRSATNIVVLFDPGRGPSWAR